MSRNGPSAGYHHVVAITGATAGVGRAVARAFGEMGWRVALLARGADGLEATAKDVESLGGRALAVPTDVAHADEVERAADAAERELGPIDVWVNCAMVSVFAEFVDIEPDEYERVTQVTYHGYVNGTRTALRRMLPRDRGVIVQVGSALAERGIPLQSAYCGAKHAIDGFTDSVRTELLHRRSRVEVSTVHLPAVNTPQFDWSLSKMPRMPQPVPPIYQPEVAARAIVHAALRPRRQIWVGGRNVLGILANRLTPGLLDVYLGRKGYESQMTDTPDPGTRPANLWKPLDGDRGAHGRFDDRSASQSAQTWFTTHRGVLAGALVAAGTLVGRAVRR